MNRRSFLSTAALGSIGALRTLPPVIGAMGFGAATQVHAQQDVRDDEALAILTEAADSQVEPTLGEMPASQFEGSPRSLTRRLRRLVTPFVWEDSRYHHDEALVPVMEEILTELEALQHEDGTYSIGNRHSPPDTGFAIVDMGIMSTILRRDDAVASDRIADRIEGIMSKAGPALATGGIHTPNHRFKVAAALARISQIDDDPAYLDRMREWLAEGIDEVDPGMYSERSPTYAAEVTNPSLLTIAHIAGRADFVDVVRRNLETSIELAEPNGEIEALMARRQDQDQRRKYIRDFYTQYRELAITDGNARFADIVRTIEERHGAELGDFLGELIERPELMAALPPREPAFVDFRESYPNSGLMRYRDGKLSASVFGGTDWYRNGEKTEFYNRLGSGLSTNPTFFRAWNGEAVLEGVRMSPNFFSMGHFRSNGIEVGEDRVRLGNQLEIPYYLPMPPERRNEDGLYALSRSVDGRFYSMLDFENRPKQTRDLATSIEVIEVEGGVDIAMDVSGEEDVEITVELTFREGGVLEGASDAGEGRWHLVSGTGSYTVGEDRITFGPGMGEGEILMSAGEQYGWANGDLILEGNKVYLTAKTPVRHTIALRFS